MVTVHLFGELVGVAYEVQQRLPQPHLVGMHRPDRSVAMDRELVAVLCRQRFDCLDDLVDQRWQSEGVSPPRGARPVPPGRPVGHRRPRLGASRVAYAFLVYMLPPLPRRSGWAYYFARSPNRVSLPRKGRRVGLRIVLFEACSAFTRVTACTLAPSPIRDALSEGFSHFVTSIAAPVASGWSGCRVGLAPTGKRRLVTAHTHGGHRAPVAHRSRRQWPPRCAQPLFLCPITSANRAWHSSLLAQLLGPCGLRRLHAPRARAAAARPQGLSPIVLKDAAVTHFGVSALGRFEDDERVWAAQRSNHLRQQQLLRRWPQEPAGLFYVRDLELPRELRRGIVERAHAPVIRAAAVEGFIRAVRRLFLRVLSSVPPHSEPRPHPSLGPAEFVQSLHKSGGPLALPRSPAQDARLLRARRERPCCRRTTEQRDELAASLTRLPRRRGRAA